MGNSNLIAGAILVLAGVLLSVTGIGVFIGVPLALLGGAVMFPNLAIGLISLAVIAVFLMTVGFI